MEIKINSEQILKVLNVLSWIIFIGVCIEAGGLLFNTFFTMALNPIGAKQFWIQIDLSDLYNHDPLRFLVQTLLICIVAILKAIMFYLIIRLFHSKKLDFLRPFNVEMKNFLFNITYLCFGIGFFSMWGIKHAQWLTELGIKMPGVENLGLAGADVWFFMGVIMYIFAHIFKRGIEIQNENELTI